MYSVVIFCLKNLFHPSIGFLEPWIPLTTPVIHVYIIILKEYGNVQNDYQ